MPLQATSGAASYDGFGGGVAAVPNYIEECFSAFLYTGNGSTQTINNGIDESGKGALTWFKKRSTTSSHLLFDTNRGTDSPLATNSTSGQGSGWSSYFNFLSNGVSVSDDLNVSGTTYASWTFRKQPKFFDVVTYTGTGSAQYISHNLGSTPGCIIVKRTDTTSDWAVYHRGVSSAITYPLYLNLTNAAAFDNTVWGTISPGSTRFRVATSSQTNASGGTYVAYLFAHNAGGFGLNGTDNVISCGSYTGNGTTVGPDVNLGYEPQFLMVKNASAVGSWFMWDSMRGITADGSVQNLTANSANAENTSTSAMSINATGFSPRSAVFSGSGSTYIYIAIRRGPMKVPTDATKVFAPISQNAGSNPVFTTGFPVDLVIDSSRSGSNHYVLDRLRGSSTTASKSLFTDSTSAESSNPGGFGLDSNTTTNDQITQFTSEITWSFRRAPSFFDEVCYTGTGANLSVSHNLGTAPQLWIVKGRNGATDWMVGSSLLANTEYLFLNATLAKQTAGGTAMWNSTYPTASTLYLGTASSVNNSASDTYVAYLFATCAGVSKCTAFTGTGTLQTIDCGFTAGSRFVLIKRTDAAGDWYVWDSSRGLSSSTDPYLLLNSTAAEVTSTNWVDTTATGFQVTAASGNNVNINGASYIALAIA